MPEKVPESVAVVFRKGNFFLVPPEPLALPYEERFAKETFESAAYRLAADHGVVRAKVDTVLNVPDLDGAPNRAYVLTDTVGQLDGSEYYRHEVELMDHITEHRTLRPVDIALFEQALKSHRHTRSLQGAAAIHRAS